MTRTAAIPRRLRSRTGSVYLFALGACGLVVVAGVTAIRIARVGLSTQALFRDADLAGREADAAMHLFAQMVTDDPSGVVWRADTRHQLKIIELTGPTNTGSPAQVRVDFSDPADDDLSDDPTGRVRASVVATVGDVQRFRDFEVEPVLTNLACLSHTLIYESIAVDAGKSLWSSGTQAVVSGGATSPRLLNVNAVKRSTGVDLSGVDALASPSAMFLPTVDSIVVAFRNLGASEVKLTGNLSFSNELISPTRFTAGTPNPQGLYIIDANGYSVEFVNSRVCASIIIINTSKFPGVKLDNSVSMAPATPGLPTLVVLGSLEISHDAIDLTEASAGRNLNPSGAPYLGETDVDALDSYPSIVHGLVYVEGDAMVSAPATMHGQLFVSGFLEVADNFILRSDLIETTNPVPGFSMPTAMRLVPESVTGN